MQNFLIFPSSRVLALVLSLALGLAALVLAPHMSHLVKLSLPNIYFMLISFIIYSCDNVHSKGNSFRYMYIEQSRKRKPNFFQMVCKLFMY